MSEPFGQLVRVAPSGAVGLLGCIIGSAGVGFEPKFDFGNARSTVVRDRPGLSYI